MGRFYDEIEHCIHRIRLLNRQEDRKLDEKNLFDQIFAMITEKCRAKSFVTFLINFLSEAEMLDQIKVVESIHHKQEEHR